MIYYIARRWGIGRTTYEMKSEIYHYNPLTVMIRSAQPRTVSTIQGNAQMIAAILLVSSTTTGAYSVKGMAMVGAGSSAYGRPA